MGPQREPGDASNHLRVISSKTGIYEARVARQPLLDDLLPEFALWELYL